MAARTPPATARLIGLVVLGVIAIGLSVFLLIGVLEGDESSDFDDRQPNPAETPTSSTTP